MQMLAARVRRRVCFGANERKDKTTNATRPIAGIHTQYAIGDEELGYSFFITSGFSRRNMDQDTAFSVVFP